MIRREPDRAAEGRPRRPRRARSASWIGLLLALPLTVPALVSCRAGRGEPARAVEREEIQGPRRFLLRSELRPPRGTLGDRITWRLEADLPGDAVPEALLREPTPSAIEWAEHGAPDLRTRGRRKLWSAAYVLRGYDLGAFPLPRVALPIRRDAKRDTLEFPLDTLYVDSLTQAMSGVTPEARGPIPTELRPIDWIVLGSAALVAALIGAAILRALGRRRGRRVVAAARIVERPEETLRRSLEALRREGAGLPRDVFHERLSDAIRRYVAAVTGVPATDRTTGELDVELRGRPGVDPKARDALIGLLARADVAKFARAEPKPMPISEALDEARAAALAVAPPPVAPPPERESGR